MSTTVETLSPIASPLAAALIDWHARHGRHDLPWQREPTPYRVWVSEVMLQQTQVATVISYYERFMQHLPGVAALAGAPPDEVLHLWSGLGYYSRARNLQRAAQQVMRAHGGELPDDVEVLARLPGIGRSTAAAIVALSHGRRAAILDGNVRRVLARYFGIDGRPGERATEQALWQYAERCTPDADVAVYTQAIMDLGATLCVRRQPRCEACPLSDGCIARRDGRVHALPAPRLRVVRRTRQVVMLLATRPDGSVLLQRRPPQGVWAGLWVPPEFDSLDAAEAFCQTAFVGARPDAAPLPPLYHAFTHFDLEITPLRARCPAPAAGVETGSVIAGGGSSAGTSDAPGGAARGAGAQAAASAVFEAAAAAGAVMEGDGALWYNSREPARVGLPAPIAALLSSLQDAPIFAGRHKELS